MKEKCFVIELNGKIVRTFGGSPVLYPNEKSAFEWIEAAEVGPRAKVIEASVEWGVGTGVAVKVPMK